LFVQPFASITAASLRLGVQSKSDIFPTFLKSYTRIQTHYNIVASCPPAKRTQSASK
jgi:hypothetical protein